MSSDAKPPPHHMEDALEWEALAHPNVFEHGVAFPCPPFMKGVKKLTLSRTDTLDLHLVAEGILPDMVEHNARSEALAGVPVGSFLEPVEVEFRAAGSTCFLRAHVAEVRNVRIGPREPIRFTQEGRPIRFRRRFSTRTTFSDEKGRPDFEPLGPVGWRTDWFINGPHEFLFTRQTRRRGRRSFERTREIGAATVAECPTGADSRDHLVVDAAGIRFAVCRVRDGRGPEWCHACAIEYAAPVPQEDVRDAIAEIVSFVIGRRLIPLGSTTFDESGATIEDEVVNPWGQGLEEICARDDRAPVPLDPASDDAERLLTALVPLYLDARTRLRLNDALLSYWLADEAYTGVDLVIYGSAVEALKNAWLASRGERRGKYMDESEFKRSFADQLAAFGARAQELGLPTTLGKKVAAAWSMTGGEELRAFLQALDLRIGTAEKRAMRERNVPAHGGIRIGADFRSLTLHANAYRVLFVRTFLKLLGHQGTYIDRATLNHPPRGLDEPAGGIPASDDESA